MTKARPGRLPYWLIDGGRFLDPEQIVDIVHSGTLVTIHTKTDDIPVYNGTRIVSHDRDPLPTGLLPAEQHEVLTRWWIDALTPHPAEEGPGRLREDSYETRR